jgi:hypothetical protein
VNPNRVLPEENNINNRFNSVNDKNSIEMMNKDMDSEPPKYENVINNKY